MEPNDSSSAPTSPSPGSPDAGADRETLQKQLRELQARFRQFTVETSARTALLEEQSLHQRKLVIGTQVTLLFLLFGTCLFVWVQMTTVRTQLAMQRPTMLQTIQQFESHVEPNLERFVRQLEDYARQHAEFAPILERHRPSLTPYFSVLRPVLEMSEPISTNAVPNAP